MDFGRLDRRIELQAANFTVSASGERSENWSVFATVWAEERERPVREIEAGGTEQAQKEIVFFIRYRSDLSERNRVVYKGSVFNIENIREIGRKEALELRCRKFQG